MKIESSIDMFVLFIIFIKVVFVLTAIGHVILTHMPAKKDANGSNDKDAKEKDAKLVYWKERTEFVFVLTMAILLIYHFHPRYHSKPMSGETKLLFFLFGWVLLITAKWNIFIKEAPWYEKIASAFD